MTNKKAQLVCPKCNYEFQYNLGPLEQDIEDWKFNLHKAQLRREQIRGNKELTSEWVYLGYEIQNCMARLSKLKARRKIVLQHRDKNELANFKQAVKELFGEEGFNKCVELTVELAKSCSIEQLQHGSYRCAGKNGAVLND